MHDIDNYRRDNDIVFGYLYDNNKRCFDFDKMTMMPVTVFYQTI